MMKMMMTMMMMVMMMMMMTSEASIIEPVCNVTSDYFDLCVSILKSDPRGATANTTGLVLILLDKAKDVATKGVKEINDLLKTKPELKQALEECSDAYKGIISSVVPEIVSGLTTGMPMFTDDGMTLATFSAFYCEKMFDKGKSPLTNLTSSFQDIIIVIRLIVRTLLL